MQYADIDLPKLAEQTALYAAGQGFPGAAVTKLVTVLDRSGVARARTGEYALRLSRQPNPQERGVDDKGTNYLAMALAKAARRQRVELGGDLSEPARRNGEVPATGDAAAWLGNSLLFIAAFSGAPTQELDQPIADWAVSQMMAKSPKPYGLYPPTEAGKNPFIQQAKQELEVLAKNTHKIVRAEVMEILGPLTVSERWNLLALYSENDVHRRVDLQDSAEDAAHSLVNRYLNFGYSANALLLLMIEQERGTLGQIHPELPNLLNKLKVTAG